jgi:Tfp pilus assembly protein PilO
MDKKSKILMGILIVATIISVGYTFYETIVLQNFTVVESEE